MKIISLKVIFMRKERLVPGYLYPYRKNVQLFNWKRWWWVYYSDDNILGPFPTKKEAKRQHALNKN